MFRRLWHSIVLCSPLFGGCHTPALSLETTNGLQGDLVRVSGAVASEFETPSPGQVELTCVEEVLSRMRAVLERVEGDERAVLFEGLPQGLRGWSGSTRRDGGYLRDGILTSHSYVPDAVDANHDRAELERHLRYLAEQKTAQEEELLRPAAIAAQLRPQATYVFSAPATLHADLARDLADPDNESWITVVQVSLPYAVQHGRRASSYGIYIENGERVLGYDVIDTDDVATLPPDARATGLGLVLSYPWQGLSYLHEWLFLSEIGGVPVAAPLNVIAHSAVSLFTAVKDTAFELTKVPLAPLASLMSKDRSTSRFVGSAIAPLENIGHIWKYHAETVLETSAFVSPVESVYLAVQTVPIIGGYLPHYFDDPWTQQSEAPPIRNFDSVKGQGAREDDSTRIFVSRGIHGRDDRNNGNATWIAHLESLLDEENVERAGLSSDADGFVVHDSPYAYGTVLDPLYSLWNLSHGYAYEMADDVLGQTSKEDVVPVVSLVGHSGGVQRVTMASRFLYRRDVFTDVIYGVAGPANGYAPTTPRHNRQILSRSEFQDADFTSQFGTLISKVENIVLIPLGLPFIGPSWWASMMSRGVPRAYKNAQVLRIEGRRTTLHRNPGVLDARRREPGLTFFRNDLVPLLTENRLLREACARVGNAPD